MGRGIIIMPKFETGELVVVSDFAGDPEVIGVRAEFVGITNDGKFLAKSLFDGKYVRKDHIAWEYCFKLSDMEV